MLGVILNVLVMAALIGLAAKWVLIQVGAPPWSYFIILPILGMVCYFLSALLAMYFIKKRAPEFASSEQALDGIQRWELTAGTGVVPKWVSWVGLMTFACFLALLVPVIARFI